LKELTLGFLLSESIIESLDDVKKIQIDGTYGRGYVLLKERKILTESLLNKRTITSGCGKGTVFYNVIDSFKSKKIEHPISVNLDNVIKLMKEFNHKSELFLTTGGVHSCALCDLEKILYFQEDIGRHNALDKILGSSLMDNLNLKDKIILTSGRISSEMLIKAAKREIPAIISRSAPTTLAIDMANALNILLIGFARGEKMNIYNGDPFKV
ncbi:MAG: fdhD, partial [Bacillota bacterium]|nr:fdhD [Bacillota bacterium]